MSALQQYALPTGRTDLPGEWIAGNVTDLVAQMGAAASSGAAAAAQINADLVGEDTEHAVTAYRARHEARTAGRY